MENKKFGVAIMIGKGPKVKGPNDKEEEQESPKQEKAEHSMNGKYLSPEALNYHTSDEKCEACEYMNKQGECSWLGMDVDPGGHCNAFAAGEAEEEEEAE